MNVYGVKSHSATSVDVNKVMLKKVLGYDNAIEIQRISFNWSEVLESRSRSLTSVYEAERAKYRDINLSSKGSFSVDRSFSKVTSLLTMNSKGGYSAAARKGDSTFKSSDTFF